MRTQTFTTQGRYSVANYPDEVCFCFNPNFIEIESERQKGYFKIEVSSCDGTSSATLSPSITASMYEGHARIYLSRLFELMFENPRLSRTSEIYVKVKDDTNTLMFTFSTLVIWGGLALGERFGALGVFNRDGNKGFFERNVVWFKNYPFSVSLFRNNYEAEFYGRYDGGFYSDTPIFRDTLCRFFSSIEKHKPLPTITSGTASGNYQIVYFAVPKRFLALKDGKYYESWSFTPNNYYFDEGPSSDYCDPQKNNRPLENVTYLLTVSAGANSDAYARYIFNGGELEYTGFFTDAGFFDLDAHRLFPNAMQKATIKYKISNEDRLSSVFDSTFDYTFFQTGENVALINLIVNHDTDGHYLRWIDRQGNLQYYLFTKGQISLKNKLGTDKVSTDTPVGGMYFANHVRLRTMETTSTYKCCAVHLSADIYEYVSSVISAPIVDLYIGKNENRDELWCPVVVQSTTANYDPHKPLNDLEFSFNIPDLNIQTL